MSVVLGTYNRLPFLEQAIESVRQNGASTPYEIIVVDGGSTDGSIAWLLEQKDVVTIVQHNRGEFRGQPIRRRSWGYFMNLGFKAAQGRYVLMISDDCLLVPGAIDAGAARFAELEQDESRRVAGVAFYYRDWPQEQEYYVQQTLGGRLMVNHGLYARAALEAVGWADEDRYLFYKADGDLCLRMWEAGYEIVDGPGAFVEHYESANAEVRQTNRDVLAKDRQAYRERWSGTFWDEGGPEQRGRITLAYDDPHRTVQRFPREGDPIPPAGSPPSRVWDVLNQALLATERFTYTPPPQHTPDVWIWVRATLDVKTVIDIGANTGDYAEYLHGFFQPDVLYAFEPLGSCQPALQQLAKRLGNMEVFRVALDDHAGEETFWENAYGPSSSLLHVSDIHKQAFPHTERESAVTVKVARLDDLLDAGALKGDVLIKIDVQGVEDRVIRGGRAVFSAAAAVLVELSFVQMYEQQPVFDEVNDLLRACGLRLAGVKNQIEDPATGQPLFVHCYYLRAPADSPATTV